MKTLIIFFIIIHYSLFTIHYSHAQWGCSCLQEGITFSTQAQVDNFTVGYPGCNHIEGNVTISGDITDLNGLGALTSIGGHLDISGNPSLANLSGLDNLNYIGGSLYLSHYDSFNGWCCDVNPMLTTLAGLDNLDSIGGNVKIGCTLLENLVGLENLILIGGGISIYANDNLTTLSGLENLVTIGGGIEIGFPGIWGIPVGNPILTDISALENIDPESIESLCIYGNSILSVCEISSICSYLASPGDAININGNAPGCNSQEEVEAACGISCLPEGITFTLQSQVDSFQVNFPGCTEIEGDVKIRGTGISNLFGLNVLTAIGGDLEIGNLGPDNPDLHNLMGLENLNHIGGVLAIRSTDSLINLSGLENLHSIDSGLYVHFNKSLSDISSLGNLDSMGGGLGISMNYDLESLTGLEGLETVQGDISIKYNNSLTDLTGLNNITSIGGTLHIGENEYLISLSGLNSLTTIGGDLRIGPTPPGHEAQSPGRNMSLTTLDGLDALTSVGGNLAIYGNEALLGLNALANLSYIGGSLGIGFLFSYYDTVCFTAGNISLLSLSGLENITSLPSRLDITDNTALNNISGLVNLTSINGDLAITGNSSLQSIAGLENIDAGSINNLSIHHNSTLSDCEAENLCEYLASPNGIVEIYSNGAGCKNPPEIAATCGMTMPCLPFGHYYFTSQDEIDNFQTGYPGCTDLIGELNISGAEISNLNGLNTLTSISGGLAITWTSPLTTLEGLESLSSVGGYICVYSNDSLVNLNGLNNLQSVGSRIFIGVQFSFVEWYGNLVLNDISGLENLDSSSVDEMWIIYNPNLSECAISSICEYLASPDAYIIIGSNAIGCNSQEEVEAACGVVVGESAVSSQQSVVIAYPNPTGGIVDFRISMVDGRYVSLKVYDVTGKEVAVMLDETMPAGEQTVRWDAGGLPAGIYLYRLTTNDQRPTNGKLVLK